MSFLKKAHDYSAVGTRKMINTLKRLSRRATFTGGILLIVHYGLHLAHGLRTNQILWEAMDTPLGRVDGLLFAAAFGAIDVALLGLYARLGGRSPRLGLAGAMFALVALLAVSVGVISFFANRMLPFAFPTAALTMFAAAILLGVASLRARSLPRWAAITVILFAVLTAPMGAALPMLEGQIPLYALFELHFVFAGLAWLVVGTGMGAAGVSYESGR